MPLFVISNFLMEQNQNYFYQNDHWKAVGM